MHDNKGIGSIGPVCKIVRVEMLRGIGLTRLCVNQEKGYIIRQLGLCAALKILHMNSDDNHVKIDP